MPARKKSGTGSSSRNLFAVVGSDEGEVKRRAKELAVELTPEQGADFGVDLIDGMVENAEQAVSRITRQIKRSRCFLFSGAKNWFGSKM
jgi:DNA polymerase III subunit delta